MDVNFGNIDVSKSFTLYDSGTYTVRIKSIEEVQAKSGNPQLRVKTVFVGGEYDEKQITQHITLIDSCAWKLAKFLNACGFDLKTLGSMDTGSGQFRKVLNKCINKTTCWVIGKDKDRNGQERNTILDMQPDPNAKPVDTADDTPEFLSESTADTKKVTIDGEEVAWDD